MARRDTDDEGGGGQQPLCNVLSVFLVHFHVRRGNELVWYKGEADCEGVEWKALPSGSHAMEHDIIYFESSSVERGGRIGVAAFRNRKMLPSERRGVGFNGQIEGEDDDQRGARLMAVGAIVECGKSASPWGILAATLPHLSRLEKMVDALSFDPSCRKILEEWLETHKYAGEQFDFPINRDETDLDMMHIHDPIYELPAITNALGPLLPSLIKRLLRPSFRLLFFVPPGVQTYRAAAIAFALGEMASCAYRNSDTANVKQGIEGDGQEIFREVVRIRGLIGLFDIAPIQDENRGGNSPSWIAWTTDKVLLDKYQLYDAILDLSPMKAVAPSDGDVLVGPATLPKLSLTQRKIDPMNTKISFELKKQTYTTREFATFRGLDELASRKAILRKKKSKNLNQSDAQSNGSLIEISPFSQLNRQRTSSTFLAFLRYWLSNLRILPLSWRLNIRESYGYVPLGIRSDGGIRASIMLLPDGDETEEENEGGSQDGIYHDDDHLSVPSGSRTDTTTRRASFSRLEEAVQDDEIDDEDPIMAAVGATKSSLRHRLSRTRSHSSASQSGIQNVSKVISHQYQAEEDGGDQSTITRRFKADSAEDDIKEAEESIRLPICIFQVWSKWVQELVQGVQDMLQDLIDGDSSRIEDEHDDGELLLRESEAPIKIDCNNLAPLRLSVTNVVDIELIQSIAEILTDRPIEVQVSWWSSAASFWA